MKLSVIGSRTFDNYDILKKYLDTINKRVEITTIVSGGAKGADSLSEKWAKENNKETLIFLHDWNTHGKKAGFLRNNDIISNCDCVLCFWDGVSKGTEYSITLSKKLNKKCLIVKFNNK